MLWLLYVCLVCYLLVLSNFHQISNHLLHYSELIYEASGTQPIQKGY